MQDFQERFRVVSDTKQIAILGRVRDSIPHAGHVARDGTHAAALADIGHDAFVKLIEFCLRDHGDT